MQFYQNWQKIFSNLMPCMGCKPPFLHSVIFIDWMSCNRLGREIPGLSVCVCVCVCLSVCLSVCRAYRDKTTGPILTKLYQDNLKRKLEKKNDFLTVWKCCLDDAITAILRLFSVQHSQGFTLYAILSKLTKNIFQLNARNKHNV